MPAYIDIRIRKRGPRRPKSRAAFGTKAASMKPEAFETGASNFPDTGDEAGLRGAVSDTRLKIQSAACICGGYRVMLRRRKTRGQNGGNNRRKRAGLPEEGAAESGSLL